MDARLERWAEFAGLLIWLAVGIPAGAGNLVVDPGAAWWICYLAYGAVLVIAAMTHRADWFSRLTMIQVPLGVAAFVLDPGYGFSSVLLIVSAAAAALVWRTRWALLTVAGQTATVGLARIVHDHGPTDLLPVAEAALFAGFQLFAVSMVKLAHGERRARRELAAANVALAAAQLQLTESARVAERLRIARDMHDVVGHQLTALAVNLEVAAHLDDASIRASVAQSHDLAKAALSDLRGAVSRMRVSSVDSLEVQLKTMLREVPGLTVHLSVDPGLVIGQLDRDEAVLRCCQEIVTNAVRHARASQVWITVARTDAGIVVLGRDDGRGSAGAQPGHGLLGMRERFEALGGTLAICPASRDGFQVEARLPR